MEQVRDSDSVYTCTNSVGGDFLCWKMNIQRDMNGECGSASASDG